jgi:rare lipoprotein A
MQQTPLALRDIFSTKVRVTIYGAIVLFIAAIAAPEVSAQNNHADAEQVSESADEPSYKQPPRVYEVKSAGKNGEAAEASDDSVRDALRSVFKETAPEKIEDNVVPRVNKSTALSNPAQAIQREYEEGKAKPLKDVKETKGAKGAKESPAKPAASKSTAKHKVAFSGVADYYADRFHGKKTASGQLHDKTKMTAAHLSLPFGTKVKVVSRNTGKSCVVTVNDRGPYTKNRIIDLSFAAAKELGLVTAGSRLVDCYLIEPE